MSFPAASQGSKFWEITSSGLTITWNFMLVVAPVPASLSNPTAWLWKGKSIREDVDSQAFLLLRTELSIGPEQRQ